MISVGIIGCSGYTGKKLTEYCSNHPKVNKLKLYSYASSGQNLWTIAPEFQGVIPDLPVEHSADLDLSLDVYFTALPHGESIKIIPSLVGLGKVVIDLSGDFRLDDAKLYEKWYHFTHAAPEFLAEKSYGLADWKETSYSGKKLISNPGCYPTVSLLSILPIVKEFADEILTVSTVAYSGTSGAGKSANADLLLSEMDGNARAYNLHHHRHEPEILQVLNQNGLTSPFSFSTHLLPVAVGMYATTNIFTRKAIDPDQVKNLFESTYKKSPFVRMRDQAPQLKWVVGSNFCDLNVSVKGSSIIVTGAIDNLIKGASGQAIQNMNNYFGWTPSLGLLPSEVNHVSVY